MKITLLTSDQYARLLALYVAYPELTLQNKGYEGIDRSILSDKAKEADNTINDILKQSICGFSKFQNFLLNKEGEIRLRFQYNWGAEDKTMYFIGVGYIKLSELLNGFKDETSTNY